MPYKFNISAWDTEQEKRRREFASGSLTNGIAADAGRTYGDSLTFSEKLNAAVRSEWSTLAAIDKAREVFSTAPPIDPNFVVTTDMIEEQAKGLTPEGARVLRIRALQVGNAYEFGQLRSNIVQAQTDDNILQYGVGGNALRIAAAMTDPLQIAAGIASGGSAFVAAKGGALARIATGGLTAAVSAVPSEVLLLNQNPLRSPEELATAMGFSAVIGGLAGGFTRRETAANSALEQSDAALRKQKWATSGIDSAPKVDDIITYNTGGVEYPIKVTGLSPDGGQIVGRNIFTNAEVKIEAGAARAPSAEVVSKIQEWEATTKKAAEDAYKADALKMVQEADATALAQRAKGDTMQATIDRAQQGRAHTNRQKDLEAAFNGSITDHTKLIPDVARAGNTAPKILDIAGEKLVASTPTSILRKGGADRVTQLLSTVGEIQAFTKRKVAAGMEAVRSKGAQRTRMDLLTALVKKADNVALDAGEAALIKEFPTMEAFDAARRPAQSASDEFINKILGKDLAPVPTKGDIKVESLKARPKDAPGVGFGKAADVTPDGGIVVSTRKKRAAKKPKVESEVQAVKGADPVVAKVVADAAPDAPQVIRKEAIQEGDTVEFRKVNKETGDEEFFSGKVSGVGNYIVVKTVDGTKSARIEDIIKHTSNDGMYRKATLAERINGEGALNKVDDTSDNFDGLDERTYSNPLFNATESPAVRAIAEALDGSPRLADDLMSACELARTAKAETGKATRKTKKK